MDAAASANRDAPSTSSLSHPRHAPLLNTTPYLAPAPPTTPSAPVDPTIRVECVRAKPAAVAVVIEACWEAGTCTCRVVFLVSQDSGKHRPPQMALRGGGVGVRG